MVSSLSRLHDHTVTHTFGRTSMDVWLAQRWDLYLTIHYTHKWQTSTPPVGFEPTIPASKQLQTHAFVIEENCQYSFHLALNLVYLFQPQRPWSLLLWWLGFDSELYPQTQATSLVITVFMTFVSWAAHCSKSLATWRRVPCLTVSSFGINLTETRFIPKSSVRIDCTKTKWKSQLIGELYNCYSPVIQLRRMYIVNHGGPPRMFITLNWCMSFFEMPKPLLNLHMVIASFPKAFWITS